mgnify:FL=1
MGIFTQSHTSSPRHNLFLAKTSLPVMANDVPIGIREDYHKFHLF